MQGRALKPHLPGGVGPTTQIPQLGFVNKARLGNAESLRGLVGKVVIRLFNLEKFQGIEWGCPLPMDTVPVCC